MKPSAAAVFLVMGAWRRSDVPAGPAIVCVLGFAGAMVFLLARVYLRTWRCST
jgi:hypothetical protein